jgi:toxin secretion/phage lysis holin
MGIDMTKLSQMFGFIVALVAGLFANMPITLQILLAVMVLDIVSGFIRAAMDKTISSAVAWRGILKKIMTLVVIMLVSAVQKVAVVQFPAVEVVAGFFLYYEAISLLENAAAAGVPIPEWLITALAQMNPDKNGRRATDKPTPVVVVPSVPAQIPSPAETPPPPGTV